MIDQQALPSLQPAVDALYARVTAGRVRATGTAIGSGLTGRTDNPTPDETDIISDVMGGRWGDRLLEVWSRDDLHVAGASEDDWALESEIAYQALRRGLTGDTLALTVERIMRAGPYRSKWDEPRGRATWLAQDVANAIKTKQQRLGQRDQTPSALDPLADPDDQIPADETWQQTIARLERELACSRARDAVQQINIRRERAEKRMAHETISAIFDVVAIPDAQMNARTKLAYLHAMREAAKRSSDSSGADLPNIAIGEGTGLSENVVSEIMQDLAARDGSVVERHVTRDWVIGEDGERHLKSTARIAIATEDGTLLSALKAAPRMGGPSDLAQRKRAKAQARAAESLRERIERQAAAWGHCTKHDNDLVALKGYCPECGEVVGERALRVDEFKILNPEMRDSGSEPLSPVVVRLKAPGFRDSGSAPTQTSLPLTGQNPAFRDSWSSLREKLAPDDLSLRRAADLSQLPEGRDVDSWKRTSVPTRLDPFAAPDWVAEWAARPSAFDLPLTVAGASDEQPPGAAPPEAPDGRDPETGIPWGFV